jgi:hypothetical protein
MVGDIIADSRATSPGICTFGQFLIVFDYCRRLCHIRSAWREAVTEKGRAGRLGLAMRRRGRAQGWTG